MKKHQNALLLACLLSTSALSQAQVIFESYETETVGAGTYSGSWKYIYTEQVLGTTVSNLNIRNGPSAGGDTGSPASGNYLEFQSATGSWAGTVYYKPDPHTVHTMTNDAWESPTGHFHRREMLDAGATYEVSLQRRISYLINGSSGNFPGGGGNAFSVWDGSAVNTVTPFSSTPDALLTMQAYDTNAGGWQQVSLTFTAPGTLGSGTVPVDFMMGNYTPSEVDPLFFVYPEFDSNHRTLDTPPAGYELAYENPFYQETEALALDDFSVTKITPVPEPTVTVLGAIATLVLARRRRARGQRA